MAHMHERGSKGTLTPRTKKTLEQVNTEPSNTKEEEVKGVDRAAYDRFQAPEDYPDFSKHNNWMSNSMTPEIYAKYLNVQTPSGYTLDMAIQTGVDNPSHPYIMTVGATAGDEETYEVFSDLFDPIIAGRHNGYPADFKQPTCLDHTQLKHAGFNEKYVLSSRVRTGRSIRGLCMPPFSSRGERREIERILVDATKALAGYREDLGGHYEGLYDMTDERHEELIDKHLMFDKPVSPLLTSGGMARDWPDARGVYLADSEKFIVWVNEEDHCRIVSMQMNGNMSEVFERFCVACTGVETEMKKMGYEYMHNDHLGYVLACPSNLGTGIRAGVHAKIPLLSKHPKFDEILINLRLQKRGVGGVDTKSEGGTFDLSNLDRLGFSEVQLVQFVCDGVDLIVKMEIALETGEEISGMIPEPIKTPWSCPRKAYENFEAAADMPDLSTSTNWMGKSLTPEIYAKYRNVATPNGYTLDMAIQTGLDNPSHPYIVTVGATAGDEETYEVFSDLFDPIIAGRHNGYPADFTQPTCLDPTKLRHSGFKEKYVLSSRVRTGRSIRGLCMPPFSSRAERREVERILVKATRALGRYRGDLDGHYEGLYDMSDERHEELIDKHLMFDKPVSPLLTSGGMARDWPDARGVYLADSEKFIVWVNEEDHCRIVSMQMDGNMTEVFTRFCNATNQIEAAMKADGHEYMHNDHLGYVLACPSNLGTGIRAGCHVLLPKLSEHEKFGEILLNLRLQKRGVGGVDTASVGGKFDISNLDRLGFSEVQLVQMVCDGINVLVDLEKALEAGESIDDKIPPAVAVPWKQ